VRLWWKLLTAALETGFTLLEAFGARGTRWEWKKQSWRRSLEERAAAWENVERAIRTRMRMCRSCRALIEAGAASCPACGASMRGVPTGGAGRVLRMLLPGAANLSTALVTANILVALIVISVGGVASGGGLLGLMAPRWEALCAFGGRITVAIAEGQVWRLVTAGYLHGGLIHLVFNCLALSSLGPLIEEAFGARRLFVIYALSGVIAFAASALFSPAPLSVGASGSIFGLLGFAFVYGRFRGGATGRAVSDHLLRWIVFGAVMIFMPGIDNAAHVGGLLSGGALGLVLDPGPPRSRALDAGLTILTGALAALTIGSFLLMALSYEANLAACSR
jgi:rhomboid protease GluP